MIAEYDIKTIADLEKTVKEMFSGTMSDMLKGELDAHLGYEKSGQEPKKTINRRNGRYAKQVKTSMGEAEISIPRDRNGEYEPQLVPNGTRDVRGIEEKVLSMYDEGMSDRDISATIEDIYGFTISHETISKLVDRVQPRLREWQSRSLESVYPFVFLDALTANVKNEGRAVKKAVYCATGINTEGRKDILGLWINETEGVHFWLTVFEELKARCVKKIHFINIDGLSGFEEAIKSRYPMAVVQRCVAHLGGVPKKPEGQLVANAKTMKGNAKAAVKTTAAVTAGQGAGICVLNIGKWFVCVAVMGLCG